MTRTIGTSDCACRCMAVRANSITLRQSRIRQGQRMSISRLGNLFVALCAGGLLLSACGQSQEPGDSAETEAGRENVEAMSREHANDTAEPSPAAAIEPARAVVSDPRMPYVESGDELVYGYFAAPSDVFEPVPAVILIHEWWGLNDNVRAMADRLAGEGYMVLAVDLYGGETATTPRVARAPCCPRPCVQAAPPGDTRDAAAAPNSGRDWRV